MIHSALLSFLVLSATFHRAAAQQAPRDSLRGAVQVVDASRRAVEITTGVGMALRVVRLQVPPAARITAGGAALALRQLQPGDVVRVSYGAEPGGYVAYTIDRVGRMADGVEATP
jgi:hypothetical protein